MFRFVRGQSRYDLGRHGISLVGVAGVSGVTGVQMVQSPGQIVDAPWRQIPLFCGLLVFPLDGDGLHYCGLFPTLRYFDGDKPPDLGIASSGDRIRFSAFSHPLVPHIRIAPTSRRDNDDPPYNTSYA